MDRLRNKKISIPKKKINKKGTIVLTAIILVIILIWALAGFITDYLWFRELGYVSVFFRKLITQLEIGIPIFIAVGLITFGYLKTVKRSYLRVNPAQGEFNNRRLVGMEIIFAVTLAGAGAYFSAKELWQKLLEFLNSSGFGLSDPLFSNDISLYVFKLPFIKEANNILIAGLAILAVITVMYMAMVKGTVRAADPADEEEPEVPPHNVYDEYISDEEAEEYEEEEPVSVLDAEADDSSYSEAFGSFSDFIKEERRKEEDTELRKEAKRKEKEKNKEETRKDGGLIFDNIIGTYANQFVTVGVLMFLLVGFHFYIKQFSILQAHTGAVYGAGFTDVTVSLWMYRALIGLSVIAIITYIIGVKKRNLFPMFILPLIMLVVFGAGEGISLVVQNYVVSPDELNKESQYLEYNIEYTQHAYGLDNVETKKFAASSSLDGEDIANNPETISNIRINDYSPTKKLYNQTQSIRQYYDFNDVDVDRYMIDGEYTQTFLSAREINEEAISSTFVNTHLKYTHGYGIALSRVDKVTSSGQADVLVGNIPPESDTESINVTNPAVYFGELTNDWILVNTDEKEFDYPDGDSNQYTTYGGSAGIRMNLPNRILFAIRERSLKLLVSSNITSDSKIVINRNIEDRVKKIMPYLTYDSDPYMVTAGGGLYWIIDAYTTSADYPYSAKYTDTSDVNYVRNSVKVVIDAYNGDVNYYIVDETDPIAQTLQKIYPKLFKDMEELGDELAAHLRYPGTLFGIQAAVYARYHMTDVNVFYQNEDLWSIANEIYGTEEKEMEPNYYILNLPGEKNAEFVNSIPYTPKNKKNMTSLLIARNDGSNYGQLVLYQFPKSKVVYGPMQVEALIDQNTEISQDFSLWTSNGTSYSRGNLFVIPIEESILYIEPVYLEAKNSSIPEVKKVIVVFGDRIAYESTLAEALETMFGESGTAASSGSAGNDKTLSRSEIISKAQDIFDKAQKASRSGNWAQYGEYVQELEKYLEMLE